jgi:hypothetical protein
MSTEAMTRLGLDQKFQQAIADPCFAAMFGIETLLFWIKNTLRINYLSLLQLHKLLKNHTNRTIVKTHY